MLTSTASTTLQQLFSCYWRIASRCDLMREVLLVALECDCGRSARKSGLFTCAFAPAELNALVRNITTSSISSGQAPGAARSYACQQRQAVRAQTGTGMHRVASNALVNMLQL
jgi:hypothetical protein